MKVKYLAATIIIILAACMATGFTACTGNKGELPVFSTGDKWVSRWHTGDQEYIVTSEITDEEFTEGKDCYVMETTFEPPYMGELTGTVNKYDKATFDIITMDFHSVKPDEFTNITYETSGDVFYPLEVGKEITKTETRTITTGNATVSQTYEVTATIKTIVEKIEKITVEAGTFQCFKLLKYDEYGVLVQITWRSADTKMFQVKLVDMAEEDAIYELIAYSVK